jgi:hypothetical protein
MIELKDKTKRFNHHVEVFKIDWLLHNHKIHDKILYKSVKLCVKQRSAIIESLILGITPRIAYYNNKSNDIQIILGDAIIDTIEKYINKGFKLTGLRNLVELNGLDFDGIKHIDFYDGKNKTYYFIENKLFAYEFESKDLTQNEIIKIKQLMKVGI